MTLEEKKLGQDLKLGFGEIGADLTVTLRGDLETVSGEKNLEQAIIARLSTEQGELYDIGHSEYGSRLHEAIGEINNEVTRRKIKAIVHECLTQESRIREITSINVFSDSHDHHRLNIEVTVLTVEGKNYLTLMYPFRLEG
jgi:phage baseplate assembly protein W